MACLGPLRPLRALRFEHWQRESYSEYSPQVRGGVPTLWANRTGRGSQTQAGPAGVAVEYMVELCEEVGAALWIAVPQLADDPYIESLAGALNATAQALYVVNSHDVGLFGGAGASGHRARSLHIWDLMARAWGPGRPFARVLTCNGRPEECYSGLAQLDADAAFQAAVTHVSIPALLRIDDSDAYRGMNLTVDGVMLAWRAALLAEEVRFNRLPHAIGRPRQMPVAGGPGQAYNCPAYRCWY